MFITGKDIRIAIQNQSWTCPTSGEAKGCVQANLVVLPKDWAYDFLLFAQRNPKACPILEVGETGDPLTRSVAQNGDIRTDIPKYFIYRDGMKTEEVYDISSLWQDDFVYFLLGCSFSFEQALLSEGLEVRNITEGRNVPMYITNIKCRDAGRFQDVPMVVSMRPFSPPDAEKASDITRYYPAVHGKPVQMGKPEEIGIKDLSRPDFGDAVTVREGEIPVFWACGVTPQMAVMQAKPPLMISHAPGHMFVGDVKDTEFKNMKDLSRQIEQRIQQDPGKRGLTHWAVQNQILPATLSLLEGDHILLATGFYILRAGAIETDGPPGALILADTLARAGKSVTLLFDNHSEEIMKSGLKYINPLVEYISLDVEKEIDPADFIREETSHFIALERPGKASDGRYYNFSGRDISGFHASLDELFTLCRSRNITTIGIGDGGNELGMGLVSEAVDKYSQKKLSCRTMADYCICAGVSNWAGYGQAALLSCLLEQNLMQSPVILNKILHSIVEAGAVDGITGKQEITVDGLVSSWESTIYEEMHSIAEEYDRGSRLREIAL